MKEGRRIVSVKVSAIEADSAMQPRVGITAEAVAEYAEAIGNGEEMPPLLVVQEGEVCWLCDGFHRLAAAKQARLEAVNCEVVEGDRALAVWLAASANLKHGVRRTNADKRRAVEMALSVRPNAKLKDIAAHCGVTHEMVRLAKQQRDGVAGVEFADHGAGGSAVANEVVHDADEVGKAMAASEGAIDKAITAVDGMTEVVLALCKTKHAVYVNSQAALNDLKNIRTALKQGLPYKRCPLCGGVGCETCRHAGWVSKRQWDLVPKTQRKE